ncbi:unnamed protein product [Rotaria sp. Silwood2]|nr:unnamed protein product [Rotaria sp. Silwood2]CAF3950155.1 unnamed protein product [Rotaria sp. Silwood2]
MLDFSLKFVYDDDYGVDLFLDTNRQRLYVTQNNRVVVFDTIKSPESGNIIVGENSGSRLPLLSHAQSTFVDINQNLYVLEMHYEEAYKLELTLFNFTYRVWYWPFSSMNATKLLQGNGKCFRIALDKNLNIYITEFDAHRVVKWHSPEYTNYSVVAGTTDIYVADKGNRRIQKWSLNAREGITVVSDVYEPKQILLDCYGNFLTNDGYRVKLYNSFVTTGLDVDSDNNRIQLYNVEDQSVQTVLSSNNGLIKPISVYVVSETSDIYVLDRINRTQFVVKLWRATSGEGTIIIPSDSGLYYDIFLDQDYNIYMSSFYEIRKWFAPDYLYSTVIATFHSMADSVPIYVDESYNVYLYDCDEPEIQMWPIGARKPMAPLVLR